MNIEDIIINATKQYFKPLKSKWFWLVVIPLSLLLTILDEINKTLNND